MTTITVLLIAAILALAGGLAYVLNRTGHAAKWAAEAFRGEEKE